MPYVILMIQYLKKNEEILIMEEINLLIHC